MASTSNPLPPGSSGRKEEESWKSQVESFDSRNRHITPTQYKRATASSTSAAKWQVVLEMRGVFILSVLVIGKNRVGCAREAGFDEKNRLFHSTNERLCKYSDRFG